MTAATASPKSWSIALDHGTNADVSHEHVSKLRRYLELSVPVLEIFTV